MQEKTVVKITKLLKNNYKILHDNCKVIIIKYKPYFLYYLMVLTALILCSGFLYIKFLRPRLPRDIPFRLTFLGFCILLGICIIYLYIIFKLVKPKQSSQMIQEIIIFFIKPIQYIITSLTLLDSNIKNSKLVNPYYKKLIEYILPTILEFGTLERVILYCNFKLFPGYILLVILMVDVFLLKSINIVYYFLFMGLLPLSYEYFRYSLLRLKEEYLERLETKYDLIIIQDENSIHKPLFIRNPKAIYHEEQVSIREYFEIKIRHLMTEYLEYHEEQPETEEIVYIGHAYCRKEIYEQYEKETNKKDLTIIDYDILQEDFKEIEPRLLALIEYIELNQYTDKMFYIKPIRIVMYLLYFITWTYILYNSIHTLYEYNMVKVYIIMHKEEILHAIKYPLILLALLCIKFYSRK